MIMLRSNLSRKSSAFFTLKVFIKQDLCMGNAVIERKIGL